MSYATRNDAFSPPGTWYVETDGLRWEAQGAPPERLPFADLVEVRLEYAPTRPERSRRRCRLTRRDGRRRDVFDRTWRGVYDVVQTGEAYVAFVEDLHARLVAAGWPGRYAGGATWGAYLRGVAGLGIFGGAAVGIGTVLTLGGAPPAALIPFAFAAFYVPPAIRWMRLNRPRTYEPHAIPREFLPRPVATP